MGFRQGPSLPGPLHRARCLLGPTWHSPTFPPGKCLRRRDLPLQLFSDSQIGKLRPRAQNLWETETKGAGSGLKAVLQ